LFADHPSDAPEGDLQRVFKRLIKKENIMRPTVFARVAGIVMLAIGVLALIPALNFIPASGLPALNVENSYGLFLGYVPMNILNKVLLMILGVAGIAASMAPATALPKSILWSRVVFVVSAVLAVLGLFVQTNTLNGYMPLYSWNVLSSAVFAVLGAYYGFALTARVPEQPMAPTHARAAGVR
jgi:hypothetical protein